MKIKLYITISDKSLEIKSLNLGTNSIKEFFRTYMVYKDLFDVAEFYV